MELDLIVKWKSSIKKIVIMVKIIKFITANSYEINPDNLTQGSGLIFEPSKCKEKLLYNKEHYLYHFFHVDSCKRFKLLIALDDSF